MNNTIINAIKAWVGQNFTTKKYVDSRPDNRIPDGTKDGTVLTFHKIYEPNIGTFYDNGIQTFTYTLPNVSYTPRFDINADIFQQLWTNMRQDIYFAESGLDIIRGTTINGMKLTVAAIPTDQTYNTICDIAFFLQDKNDYHNNISLEYVLPSFYEETLDKDYFDERYDHMDDEGPGWYILRDKLVHDPNTGTSHDVPTLMKLSDEEAQAYLHFYVRFKNLWLGGAVVKWVPIEEHKVLENFNELMTTLFDIEETHQYTWEKPSFDENTIKMLAEEIQRINNETD